MTAAPQPQGVDRSAYDRRLVVDAPPLLAEFNRAGVIDPVDVHTAMTVGQMLGGDDPLVDLAFALAVRGTRFGHVCVDLSTVRETIAVEGVASDVLGDLPWPEEAAWRSAVEASPLGGDGDPSLALVLDGDCLYLERYWDYERSVAEALIARLDRDEEMPEGLGALIEELLPRKGDDPDLQRLAVAVASTTSLAVITGGPGTGKTFTISRLLGVLYEAAARGGVAMPTVAIGAPTGKAAARLTDEIRAAATPRDSSSDLTMDLGPAAREALASTEASTLHRMLGWHAKRGRFHHDASDPLPADIVIVDEMSMVSLPMMAKLLQAVRTDAKLVLVGDPDQLVSIEAGTVLGDLVGPAASGLRLSDEARSRLEPLAGPLPPSPPPTGGFGDRVVALDRGFRVEEGSDIPELADAIRAGDGDAAVESLRSASGDLEWYETTQVEAEDLDELMEQIKEHAQRLSRLARDGDAEEALNRVTDLAVLSAHRRGRTGVGYLNSMIESRVLDGPSWSRDAWYPGRPVMVTSNDYQLVLYNGDIGVTVAVDGGVSVAFPDQAGHRLVGPARLSDVDTVHAMTIHKSQGSQFDRVVVLLPDEESRLLTRELLYTAVTRARRQVTIVGTEEALRAGIERRVTRSSGLRQALWDASDV